MHLYNLTLQTPTASLQAIVGNFSGARQQEIIISHGTRLQLLRPDIQTGKLSTIIATDVFGSIRTLASFRLTGGTKDYAIVGSDSGRIVILDYDPRTSSFVKVHQETFGKSGARRIVPGQYLATDPKGRAVMIAAVEKSKLAHRSSSIVHHIVGVDVGFENPMFAALEVDYTESDQDPTGEAAAKAGKMLTYYELDLGLNHVVRKWSEPTDPKANFLVQVPGGQLASSERFDGPSGVLVCTEDHIIYRNADAPQHRVPIPRRKHPLGDSGRGIIIIAAVMHKMKGAFFFLLQSEEGDLYKITIEHEDEEVKALKIKYFDTVPVASGLCILKSGFLFVASEFGNQQLYQFQKLGDDDDEKEFTDEIESLNPILDAKVLNLLPNSDSPQIFTLNGRGSRSMLRTLRHGLEVEETVSSDLPGIPNAVWTVKVRSDETYDSYIILSFVNGTLVLSIGENIEEVQDTGFLSSAPTLAVQQIGDDALLQVHPQGIRHVLVDRRSIVAATTNKRQVVVALNSAELVYFELDLDGQLNEYQDRKAMGSTVLAMSIGEVPEVATDTISYQTVRIILRPGQYTGDISLQALTSPPSSICIPTMFVNIGLQTGVLLRTVLDPVSGQLTDTRTIRLIRVQIKSQPAILALSSRTWLNYTHQNLMHFTPLIFDTLDYAWGFSAELCPEGLIGITGNVLRIFQISKLGTKLKQDALQLSYTPRKFTTHPDPGNNYFYLIESDHRVLGEVAAGTKLQELRSQKKTVDDAVLELPSEQFGRPKAPAGTWGSCIRIVDPIENKTVRVVHLDNNEAAFSLAVVPFEARENELHLVVGTAQDTLLSPRSCTSGFLRVYKFTNDGAELELVHKTELDDVPLALLSFQGRLEIYDIGKKKMLRKVENKTFGSAVVTLNTQGSRILVGDMQESVYFAVYKAPENRLLVFADDGQPRWITCSTMVDYTTVAAGDRFGNIFVNRLDPKVSDQTQLLAHIHIGDLITSIHKVPMVAGGREVLLYTCLHGTIGVLVPLASKEDGPPCMAGYYVPVKAVTFARLPPAKQSAIAGELDRTVGEVLKKLEQLRVTTSGF
ncbi:mono-functional DNA-alkylating methyl methanesulfonate N-term-domain-containing protein [Russula vinacea]|nr:mono-functional DNA-alkylating methyl methanesulfonate N-term-domain-containing protein [Russula vinacea]